LFLGLQSDIFASDYPTKILYGFLSLPLRSACLTHPIICLIELIIFAEEYLLWNIYYEPCACSSNYRPSSVCPRDFHLTIFFWNSLSLQRSVSNNCGKAEQAPLSLNDNQVLRTCRAVCVNAVDHILSSTTTVHWTQGICEPELCHSKRGKAVAGHLVRSRFPPSPLPPASPPADQHRAFVTVSGAQRHLATSVVRM
jgi:hypothetical protein